jgi:hypothetical protein
MRIRAMQRLVAATLSLTLLAAACGEDDPVPTAASADAHDELVAANADAVPTVAVDVVADPAGGVNVTVATTNFTVAAESASTDHVDGEGHFHLILDGTKQLRFYNESIYYAGVTEGDVSIAVGLTANDHRSYGVDGEAIVDTVEFAVPAHAHDAHAHDPAEAAESVDFEGETPTLALVVEDDPSAGWNAFVTVDGFTLSAEHASGDHAAGEGHLHIYANGQKLGRLYGEASHLSALPEGTVEISVVAYTNDHRPYLADGQPISAAATIEVAT